MTQLPISQIKLDDGTQPRAQLDFVVIGEYAEAMKAGAQFPPVTVFYDGADYWLADGFHRVKAAEQNGDGLASVEVDVRQGARRDAILHACGANTDHGLRRTNSDKRRSVITMLHDDEWRQWSDREIARRCAVSNAFVGQVRAELVPQVMQDEEGDVLVPSSTPAPAAAAGATAPGWPAQAMNRSQSSAKITTPSVAGKSLTAARKTEKAASRERIVKRGGKQIRMSTANIGKKKAAKKTPAGTASKAQLAGKVIKIDRVEIAPVTASSVCPACAVEPTSYDRKGIDPAAVWVCGDCGAPVIVSVALADESVCPVCGQPVSKGAAFCGHCGEVIK